MCMNGFKDSLWLPYHVLFFTITNNKTKHHCEAPPIPCVIHTRILRQCAPAQRYSLCSTTRNTTNTAIVFAMPIQTSQLLQFERSNFKNQDLNMLLFISLCVFFRLPSMSSRSLYQCGMFRLVCDNNVRLIHEGDSTSLIPNGNFLEHRVDKVCSVASYHSKGCNTGTTDNNYIKRLINITIWVMFSNNSTIN